MLAASVMNSLILALRERVDSTWIFRLSNLLQDGATSFQVSCLVLHSEGTEVFAGKIIPGRHLGYVSAIQ